MKSIENARRLARTYDEARAGYLAAREEFIAGLAARLREHELNRLADYATKAFAASEIAYREWLGERSDRVTP